MRTEMNCYTKIANLTEQVIQTDFEEQKWQLHSDLKKEKASTLRYWLLKWTV